jgi:hypothetical protein
LQPDNRGQSTVEYLVVTFTLVAALITLPSIYQTVSHNVANKYHSYSFGVAVSDPPRKAFDDAVQQDADRIENIFAVLADIEDLISDSIFPDLSEGKLPSLDDIKKFKDLLKRLL